jgi:hypothetical protein
MMAERMGSDAVREETIKHDNAISRAIEAKKDDRFLT